MMRVRNMKQNSFRRAEEIFLEHNGILRNAEAKALGIDEPTLIRMVEAGLLKKEARGLYRLASLPPLGNPDLVQVSKLVPKSVICLISALNFYNLTTQIPHKIYIALPQKSKTPKIEYPPLSVIYLSDKSYSAGIEEHLLDGLPVRIYSIEKTVTDCFKFRNKIGEDIAIEALKDCLRMNKCDLVKLQEYARINNVANIIRPYLLAAL
jgi:predicted transcriptional regulator of viral defense system